MTCNPFCPQPDCDLTNTRVVLRDEAAYPDGSGSLAYEFRICERCRLGFVHPTPSVAELAPLYTEDYAYYRGDGDRPDREAGSLKYTLARLRYGHLTGPEGGRRARRVGALLAAAAEALRRKTLTFSLGVPLTLPRDARILDYGYGTGLWLRTLRRRGYTRLAGYDIAANRQRAQLAAEGIETLDDGELDALPGASFDCIRLEHVFEHLPEPMPVLRRLHALLRPGAVLVMTFPSIHPWLKIDKLADSPHRLHLQLPIHVAHHSETSARRLLEAAGFVGLHTRITRGEGFVTALARRPASAGA